MHTKDTAQERKGEQFYISFKHNSGTVGAPLTKVGLFVVFTLGFFLE